MYRVKTKRKETEERDETKEPTKGFPPVSPILGMKEKIVNNNITTLEIIHLQRGS